MDDSTLLTGAELAERLRVSNETIRRWTRLNHIPTIRLGRRIIRYDYAAVLTALQKSAADNGSVPRPRPRTPRDDLFDVLVATFGLDAKAEGSRIGRLINMLVKFQAAPADIAVRLERYRRAWPNAADTPEALVKHWARFGADGTGVKKRNIDYSEWDKI